ncbi:hypothetical protein [Actinomadura sp. 6K520]|jgi:hypothetical protein|uniref:hypothetical protein n=1 Tax=Actinomadura sp. 6K520 TaxID=2530364 RepID=UPI001404AFD9|nr:hypothetical protein [Actinomadura sp. 6K520]
MSEQVAVGDRETLPLGAALGIAHGAYEQTMRQQGMLPDAIKVIRAMAEQNINELDEEE